MPIVGSFLAADAAASAIAADAIATAAFADIGMGAATSALGAGMTGEALTGLMGGLEGAGGLASLPSALTSALPNIQGVNPEIASQVMEAANAAQIPAAGTPIGTGQIGSGITGLAQQAVPPNLAQIGAGQIGTIPQAVGQGLQAGNFAQSIPTEVAQRMAQLNTGLAGPGVNLASAASGGAEFLPPATPVPAEAAFKTVADTMAPANPLDFGAPPPGAGNPFSEAYQAWKNSDPLIKYGSAGLGAMKFLGKPTSAYAPPEYSGPLSKIKMSPNYRPYAYRPYAAGGPVEEMSRENAIGANTGYPQADINQGAYATPWQTPVSRNVVTGPSDANVDQMTGIERLAGGGVTRFDGGGAASAGDAGGDAGGSQSAEAAADAYSPSMYGPMMYSPAMMSSSLVDPAAAYAEAQPTYGLSTQNFQNFLAPYGNLPGLTQAEIDKWVADHPKPEAPVETPSYSGEAPIMSNFASGGISSLGGYSDGGRLLRGPGDGMSDGIPASISGKQPARLADGEFVVPADVVSGLGNGFTDAGAKHLYKMMDKVRQARTGTKNQGKQINPRKYMPV